VGKIYFDVTHLKDTDCVRRMQPQSSDWLPYYTVSATFVVIMDGRIMRYELRLPGQSNRAASMGQVKLVGTFQLGPV
jgi:hypothetical protein